MIEALECISVVEMHKFCGNCAWLKNKAYPTSRFVEACREVAVKRGETPVEVFATLVHEALP